MDAAASASAAPGHKFQKKDKDKGKGKSSKSSKGRKGNSTTMRILFLDPNSLGRHSPARPKNSMSLLELQGKGAFYPQLTITLNSGSTVSDLLLSLTARYTMVRVAPSMQPCTTSPYLMSLWFPSICHRAYGAVIVYSRRGIRFRFRAATPAGSTRWSEARTRSRETAMPSPSRNPAVMTAPRPLLQSLCCFTKASSSSSETVRFGSSKPEVFRQVYKVLSETSTCKAIFFHDSPTSRH